MPTPSEIRYEHAVLADVSERLEAQAPCASVTANAHIREARLLIAQAGLHLAHALDAGAVVVEHAA